MAKIQNYIIFKKDPKILHFMICMFAFPPSNFPHF